MKKIIGIFVLSALLFACDTTDETSLGGRTDTVYFDGQSADLDLTNVDPGTVSFDVIVSKSSNSERTINLEVDASSTAITTTYTIDSASLYIPANSISGTVTVNGVYDDTIPYAGTETLVLNLLDSDGVQSTNPNTTPTNKQFTININRSCINPATLPADYFVGDYTIADLVGTIGPDNGTENFLSGTVTLSVNASNPNQRDFTTAVYPAFTGSAPVNTSLMFMNDGSIVLADIDTGIGCSAPNVLFGSAGTSNTNWVICEDDNTITINYLEDPLGSCNGGNFDASFTLTKVMN